MKRLKGIAVVVAMTASLVGAASASAATEFGDTCAADEGVSTPYTLATLSTVNSGLPLTAPVSGVITKVKVQIGLALPIGIPEQVKVLRPAGGNNYTVVSQTEILATTGSSVANARIPVQAGDRLGMHGTPFTYSGTPYEGYEFYCEGVPGDVLGAVLGDAPLSTTKEFTPATQGRVPLSATIEPDVDGDGFGDETQDACPQSATTQAPCPVVTLNVSATAQKKLVTLLVTGPVAANVTVNGVVSLGKGKKAKLKGGTKAVTPGAFTKFKLKFTSALTKRLEELPPSKKLTLKVTSSAPNVVGAPTKETIKLKLKGQG
jgi:hypothetical protein